ncbi:carbohydrate ABC transporter permease [Paenibacillus urinalis]|uniref:Carbohydrate ABC transporter permease n=1 Tax=Paenibacillus urinalis TaxID=521520 RepID=A0AAX3N198_9BACL|nr:MULTISPECIES: carbohydrate ABC transporter permease [Paenibacillus]WDH83486.1 carbohydrate ABC transporter permease [Paenibacillus urinalis]WDH99526.1 carbohydrate ABC transporter permease [Paenibacillus urinalis]WDI03158.1 carbohydrate ABC transporter permease [Paenibacillus urinalis]GAK41864.1 sugar ABC transporter permease protein [Paenibacillus sp. TCA20]
MAQSQKKYFMTFVSILITAMFLFPVYWMIKTSLTPITDLFATPPKFGVLNATFQAYVDNFIKNQDMLRYIGNSFIVAIGTMLMTLLFAVPGAYAMARLNIRGKSIIMILLLAIQMLPGITMAMPLFIMFSKVQLVDSYLGLILADMIHALPFAVLILRPAFMALPKGLEEAAAIDGCNRFTAFTRIMLPLVVPSMMTVAVFCFLFGWGDFVFALTLTTDDSVRPLTLGLYRFIGQYGTEWNNLMAVATIAALPIIVIFIALQRYVVGGIVAGSMKD